MLLLLLPLITWAVISNAKDPSPIVGFYKLKQRPDCPWEFKGIHTHTAVARGKEVWFFGGLVQEYKNRGGAMVSDQLFWYDSESNKWSWIEKKPDNWPVDRCLHSADVRGDSMFIFGGRRGVTMMSLGDLWEFRFSSPIWKERAMMVHGGEKEERPQPRHSHGSAIWGDNLYIFGGSTDDHSVWMINVSEESDEKWERMEEAKAPFQNVNSCVVLNDAVYVLDVEYKLYKFHFASLTWTEVDEVNSSRRPYYQRGFMTGMDQTLYIITGGKKPEIFTTTPGSGSEWGRIVEEGGENAASKGREMKRQGSASCTIGRSIFVFGGWDYPLPKALSYSDSNELFEIELP